MKNYKLDIKEMTETFNNSEKIFSEVINEEPAEVTQEQMSEMVQKHAFQLGYLHVFTKNNELPISLNLSYMALYQTGGISSSNDRVGFNLLENKKIGLEFFSIKPQKLVDVRMPEEDAMAFFEHREVCTSITTPKENIKKWELLK